MNSFILFWNKDRCTRNEQKTLDEISSNKRKTFDFKHIHNMRQDLSHSFVLENQNVEKMDIKHTIQLNMESGRKGYPCPRRKVITWYWCICGRFGIITRIITITKILIRTPAKKRHQSQEWMDTSKHMPLLRNQHHHRKYYTEHTPIVHFRRTEFDFELILVMISTKIWYEVALSPSTMGTESTIRDLDWHQKF